MPEECAFCPATANNKEHIFSDWMNLLLPGEKRMRRLDPEGNSLDAWTSPGLDLKAKVVCESCNNGWMSALEQEHAMPAIADLIIGNLDVPISQQTARSIALFAFKTAVILDHMSRSRSIRFFPKAARHRFKSTLEIPFNVRVWIAGYLKPRTGACFTLYPEHAASVLELYVCNYRAGHFAFQVVAERKPTFLTILPAAGFEHLAVPLWPRIPEAFTWPPDAIFATPGEFRKFGMRWGEIAMVRFTGD
jgi:hypothetical protein